jgi:hypothetical protein
MRCVRACSAHGALFEAITPEIVVAGIGRRIKRHRPFPGCLLERGRGRQGGQAWGSRAIILFAFLTELFAGLFGVGGADGGLHEMTLPVDSAAAPDPHLGGMSNAR